MINSQKDRQLRKELEAKDEAYRRELHRECTAHANTRDELGTQRRFQEEIAQANAFLGQELLQSHNAQIDLQRALATERVRHERLQYQVDTLVDVLQQDQDGQDLSVRSRQIGDIIIDIDSKINKEYRARMQERDDCIVELKRQLTFMSERVRRGLDSHGLEVNNGN